MDCQHARFAMQTALDAASVGPPPHAVREHLAACPACRRFWAEQQAIESGLHALAEASAEAFPEGLHRKIMAALAEGPQGRPAEARPARRAFRSRLGLGVAASFLFILCASTILLRQPGAPSAPQGDPAPAALSVPELNLAALDPATLLEGPKQDLKELTGSILAVTGVFELSQTAPAPDPTPAT